MHTSCWPSSRAVLSVTDSVFDTSIYGPSGKHEGHELKWKKQDAVTFSEDRENEVDMRCLLYLLEIEFQLESTPRSQAACTLEYGPLNQKNHNSLSLWETQ